MPGSATIDPNVFIDSLIEVVDDVRRDIAQGLGARQFRVFTVQVTPPPRLGLGSPTCTETELDPRPVVKPYKTEFEMEPCGIDEAGLVQITEVSLTYTEPELTGKNLADGVEFYYKLTDGHGQQVCERYYTLKRPPYPARTCVGDQDACMGWILWLQPAGDPNCP
jgi:hypothetical protein